MKENDVGLKGEREEARLWGNKEGRKEEGGKTKREKNEQGGRWCEKGERGKKVTKTVRERKKEGESKKRDKREGERIHSGQVKWWKGKGGKSEGERWRRRLVKVREGKKNGREENYSMQWEWRGKVKNIAVSDEQKFERRIKMRRWKNMNRGKVNGKSDTLSSFPLSFLFWKGKKIHCLFNWNLRQTILFLSLSFFFPLSLAIKL